MPKPYIYNIYKKDKIVGTYSSLIPITGGHVVVYESYKKALKRFLVPVTIKKVSYNLFEIVLDVARKSNRQIGILKGLK